MSSETQPSPDSRPSMQLMRLLWPGAMAVQAVHVAAKLGVADVLVAGPKTVEEIAAATHANAPFLRRFLGALTSIGIFSEDSASRFCQTPLSDVLRTNHPESARPWAMMLGAGFVWRPTGELAAAIESGRAAFEHVYGAQFFRYLAQHPDDAAIFNAAMSSSPAWIDAIVSAYDFSKFKQIVDVGGGRGALLVGILSANPRLRGVLYDLPGVADGVTSSAQGSIADRLEVRTGDFFDSVPAGADAYLLSGVIHDWPDGPAATILKNVRRAIRPEGRLLVLDAVLTRSNDPAQAMMDLAMMVLTGGQERSESQFRSLLSGAGFSLMSVKPTMGASVLESRPI
jgi:hypothetical protein